MEREEKRTAHLISQCVRRTCECGIATSNGGQSGFVLLFGLGMVRTARGGGRHAYKNKSPRSEIAASCLLSSPDCSPIRF
jgi:hypothetical protein